MVDDNMEQPTGFSGHRRYTMDDLAMLQPGLAMIMPIIGNRWWTLYYAAKADNWVLAGFELNEIKELMEVGAITRPKYESQLIEFMDEHLSVIERSIKGKDWEALEAAYEEATNSANAYHDANKKGYIVWKLPDVPPSQLDLTPKITE